MEVYDIQSMTGIDGKTGDQYRFLPLYANNYHDHDNCHYWYKKQIPTWKYGDTSLKGYEHELFFIGNHYNTDFNHSSWSINAELICTNRETADTLSYASDSIQFSFNKFLTDDIEQIDCRLSPTSNYRINRNKETLLNLLTHLKINYLSTF